MNELELPGMEGVAAERRASRRARLDKAEADFERAMTNVHERGWTRVSNVKLRWLRRAIDELLEARKRS